MAWGSDWPVGIIPPCDLACTIAPAPTTEAKLLLLEGVMHTQKK